MVILLFNLDHNINARIIYRSAQELTSLVWLTRTLARYRCIAYAIKTKVPAAFPLRLRLFTITLVKQRIHLPWRCQQHSVSYNDTWCSKATVDGQHVIFTSRPGRGATMATVIMLSVLSLPCNWQSLALESHWVAKTYMESWVTLEPCDIRLT